MKQFCPVGKWCEASHYQWQAGVLQSTKIPARISADIGYDCLQHA
jgi:hypothetical protein